MSEGINVVLTWVLRVVLVGNLAALVVGAGWLVFSACERAKHGEIEKDAE